MADGREIPNPCEMAVCDRGVVHVGDKVWATETQRFIDVTPEVLNHLGFLDAMSVEECVCVIRRI